MARPRMKDQSKKKIRVGVTLSPDVRELATKRGINLSQLLENAILREVSKGERDTPK